jgi:DNA repair protein RecN (Recombination protein N)
MHSESENAALGVLSGVLSRLRPLVEYDATLRETMALLESGEAQLREAAHALRHYIDRIEIDPGRLSKVEQRLEAVHNAARKFRAKPEALPEVLASLRSRLDDLQIAADVEALSRQEQAARSQYDGLAARLSSTRKAATKRRK